MARMVPPQFDSPQHKDLAEYVVYQGLSKLDQNYSVWYSRVMDRRRADGTAYIGESDFIIFHPQQGLLLLEIKGGQVRQDQDGRFFSRSGEGTEYEIQDPFIQASNNLFDLVTEFEKYRHYKLKACTYGVCLPFTVIDHRQNGISAHRDRFLDHDAVSPASLKSWIEHLYSLIAVADRRIPEHIKLYLTQWLDNRIQTDVSLRALMEMQKREISRLDYCQDVIIDMFQDKNRAAFQGSAGTGKTWIAMKKARQLAQEGKKVLFLCYNRYLRDILQIHLQDPGRSVHTYTFHGFLNSRMKHLLMDLSEAQGQGDAYIALMDELYALAGETREPGAVPDITPATLAAVDLFSFENTINRYRDRLPGLVADTLALFRTADKKDYWTLDFPSAFQYLLAELKSLGQEGEALLSSVQYDAVIIDEAQDFHELWVDIIRELYQDYRRRIIYIFYDDNQNIFQAKDSLPILSLISNWGDREYFLYRLRDNIRNTAAIFRCTTDRTGIGRTSHPLMSEGGVEPVTGEGSLTELRQFILEHIRPLAEKHRIPWAEIILLCNVSLDKTAKLTEVFSQAGLPLSEYQGPGDRNGLAWSTIQSYKGLESSIVFLLTFRDTTRPETLSNELTYIGMTRAKYLLYMFELR